MSVSVPVLRWRRRPHAYGRMQLTGLLSGRWPRAALRGVASHQADALTMADATADDLGVRLLRGVEPSR